MIRFLQPARTRAPKLALAVVAAAAGFSAAALVGVALAKTFTVQVAKSAKVTNQSGATTTENIAVNSHRFAVYMLSGDSQSHPKCTRGNGCFAFWPPLKVSSPNRLSKASGLKGKLGAWHRDGFFQVTLAGHPLYRYAGDTQRRHATGQGILSFGGTWHVIKAAGSTSGSTTTPTTTMTTTPTTTTTTPTTTTTTTTTTPTTTTTTTCAYPPYC